MSEQLSQNVEGVVSSETQAHVGKITLLEALAEDTIAVGIDRSNHSTPQGQADFDDQ